MESEILRLVAPAAMVMLALAQWAAWRRGRRTLARMEAELERVRQDLAALLEAGHGLGRRVVAQQSAIDRLGNRAAAVEGHGVPASRLELASALVRQGVTPEVVVERCALTRAEADLLTRLHGARHAA